MGINERVLNILSLESVDDIIIDAPYFVDEVFLKDFNISVVAEGRLSNTNNQLGDPFRIPKLLGIFSMLKSENGFTTNKLIDRIRMNQDMIRNAVERKKIKQNSYYQVEQAKEIKTKEF